MQTGDTIIQDRQAAQEYDEQARKTGWHAPEVVFGLAYEFTKPGQKLVDIGIGSGLSSIPFHKAGLQIYGLDGSSEVLEVCEAKEIATELKLHDLRALPLPYASGFADHIICVAVLNSFRDLAPLFEEFARVLAGQGILGFTVEEQKEGQAEGYAINRVELSEQPKPEDSVMLCRHSQNYITEVLACNGFSVLKSLEFVAFQYPAENRNVSFKAYIARRGVG